jgi:parvulin-like peptidyl-prolyl isomerase
MLLRSQFQGEEFTKQYEKLSQELLNNMITELLLLQEARKMGMDVSEQVKMAIENIKKENGIETDEQLRRIMLQQGIDFDVWKKKMEENFLKQNVIYSHINKEIVIEDSEVISYYKQHPEEFTEPEEYTLKAIYLDGETRAPEEVEALKKEILAKVNQGRDFGELAAEYSDGPAKENEGDLGSFKRGELEPTLEKAVQSLTPGELSSWLHVRNGWYLLKLVSKKDSRLKSFEEVRSTIEEKLFQQKREKKSQEFIENLRKKSYIKILISNPLDWI